MTVFSTLMSVANENKSYMRVDEIFLSIKICNKNYVSRSDSLNTLPSLYAI